MSRAGELREDLDDNTTRTRWNEIARLTHPDPVVATALDIGCNGGLGARGGREAAPRERRRPGSAVSRRRNERIWAGQPRQRLRRR